MRDCLARLSVCVRTGEREFWRWVWVMVLLATHGCGDQIRNVESAVVKVTGQVCPFLPWACITPDRACLHLLFSSP